MELRAYWLILKRRWLLVVLPAAVALAVALITYRTPGPLYNAGVRFIVGQSPADSTAESDEERLANWKTSEYIVNTLADWARGGQFAGMVSQRLAEQNIQVDPIAIRDSIVTDSTRSMMTFSMNYGDAATLARMMDEAAYVLVEENAAGLPPLNGAPAEVIQLDQPIVNRVPRSILDQMDLPLRVFLALAAGIGLALLVEYLDPTVRDRDDVERMDLLVIGEIPRK